MISCHGIVQNLCKNLIFSAQYLYKCLFLKTDWENVGIYLSELKDSLTVCQISFPHYMVASRWFNNFMLMLMAAMYVQCTRSTKDMWIKCLSKLTSLDLSRCHSNTNIICSVYLFELWFRYIFFFLFNNETKHHYFITSYLLLVFDIANPHQMMT